MHWKHISRAPFLKSAEIKTLHPYPQRVIDMFIFFPIEIWCPSLSLANCHLGYLSLSPQTLPLQTYLECWLATLTIEAYKMLCITDRGVKEHYSSYNLHGLDFYEEGVTAGKRARRMVKEKKLIPG